MIRTVGFTDGAVEILDQRQLPDRVAVEQCQRPEEVAEAIQCLKVRGAPLIGVVAAYGLALAIVKYQGTKQDLDSYFYQNKAMLAATRPTAVNLFWALERMDRVYKEHHQDSLRDLAAALVREAEAMYEEDIAINKAIGEHGQKLLGPDSRIMTICNAGTLATCGYGTALGVIRSAAARSKIQKVWACETRPVLQGARLTVWELMQDGIPVTLITDGMAGHTMKLGLVDAVITGADRIAANGDTANKIGTYSLAVLAHYNKIPFYVAAPLSTIDMTLGSGHDIVIEERHEDEVRWIRETCLTVPEANVFNPAFDVTPHELIAGIITERGVVKAPFTDGLKRLFEGQ